ncbi:MAG: OmpA family protein [Bacteroidetes bacterium]|nr:OmpA family protein [Bacteroidota bacterium]
MKTFYFLLLVCSSFYGFGQQKILSLYFENKEYTLTSANLKNLDQYAEILTDSSILITAIQINGYTDEKASDDFNITLSKNRAEAVYNNLSSRIPANGSNKIKVQWYGETIPENPQSGYHYGKRCVDIIITYTQAKVEEIPVTDNIQDLLDKLKTPKQYFTIDPDRDTVIYGIYGTVINIPADAFYIPESKSNEPVEIILQESYTVSDMLLNGLTTVSGKSQLQTDGMLYVNAKIGSRMLTLKDDKALRILIPTDTLVEGMQFFNGAHDANGNMNWQFKKVRRKDCPYLFCGMRNDLGLVTPAYTERKSYNRINWKAYNAYVDSLCIAFNVKNRSELNRLLNKRQEKEANTNFYMVEATGLGFMNCDRFIDLPEEQKTIVMVNAPLTDNVVAYMVFKSFKSILPTNYASATKMGFANVGKGNSCYVVLIKYENKTPYLSITELEIAENATVQPVFNQMTEAELKAALNKLNT